MRTPVYLCEGTTNWNISREWHRPLTSSWHCCVPVFYFFLKMLVCILLLIGNVCWMGLSERGQEQDCNKLLAGKLERGVVPSVTSVRSDSKNCPSYCAILACVPKTFTIFCSWEILFDTSGFDLTQFRSVFGVFFFPQLRFAADQNEQVLAAWRFGSKAAPSHSLRA